MRSSALLPRSAAPGAAGRLFPRHLEKSLRSQLRKQSDPGRASRASRGQPTARTAIRPGQETGGTGLAGDTEPVRTMTCRLSLPGKGSRALGGGAGTRRRQGGGGQGAGDLRDWGP